MLARSQGPRLDPNQENPHRQPHKTPARPALAGKNATTAGPAPVTGGKGVLGQTARTGRVLGAKDRNQGKHGNAPGEFHHIDSLGWFSEAGDLPASSLAVWESSDVSCKGHMSVWQAGLTSPSLRARRTRRTPLHGQALDLDLLERRSRSILPASPAPTTSTGIQDSPAEPLPPPRPGLQDACDCFEAEACAFNACWVAGCVDGS